MTGVNVDDVLGIAVVSLAFASLWLALWALAGWRRSNRMAQMFMERSHYVERQCAEVHRFGQPGWDKGRCERCGVLWSDLYLAERQALND